MLSCSGTLHRAISRLFDYTYGMLDNLIIVLWSVPE